MKKQKKIHAGSKMWWESNAGDPNATAFHMSVMSIKESIRKMSAKDEQAEQDYLEHIARAMDTDQSGKIS